MTELEKKIQYKFNDKKLAEVALTHSSYTNENRGGQCYERLEFLGDSVLGLLTAEMLYESFPKLSEGELTKRRAMLVCESSLAEAANELGLGAYIRVGKGEENTGGRGRPSILADVVEALIAAIYLDGGMERARHFAVVHVFTAAQNKIITDYKTVLQERVQAKSGVLTYRIVGESGPDHAKRFKVQVEMDGKSMGEGTGASKKEAEQLAAQSALSKL